VIICVALLFSVQSSSDAVEGDSYAVGPNDVIEIKVLDHNDLRTMTTVTSDGTITFPYIGTVSVKGMSLADIEGTITKRLGEGYIKYPVVSVSLVRSLSKKIFSYGEVGRRGEITWEENMTVLKALSMAGGATENGIFGVIRVSRKSNADNGSYKTVAESELINGVIDDKKVANVVLQNDDILIVERSKTFLVQGETVQRGRFVLEKDATVLRALLLAGGVSKEGLYGRIKLRRKQKSEAEGYKDIAESKLNEGVIEDGKVENILLQHDDILIVERSKTFLVQGETAQRGRFVLEKDATVLRALLLAGGVSKEGLYGRIKLRRKQKSEADGYKDIAVSKLKDGGIEDKKVENILLQPDDILIVERSETFMIHGEVAVPGKYVLEHGTTVLSAISVARGIRDNGLYGKITVRRKQGEGPEYKDIDIDLKGIAGGHSTGEMLLHPDDTLIVERSETYFVYGEVLKPGEFVLQDDMTVFKAINISGGFTKWGSESRVKLLRPKKDKTGFETIEVRIDDIIDGDLNADILLEPGDTIVASKGVF
jgi:polysaccharide export outer membrane protein